MEGIQEWDLNCTFVEAGLGVIIFFQESLNIFLHFQLLLWIEFVFLIYLNSFEIHKTVL